MPATTAPSTTTRKAYDLIAEGYGDGINGPLQVVVETATLAEGPNATVSQRW